MQIEIIEQDNVSLNKDLPAKTTYLCVHLQVVKDLLFVLELAVQCATPYAKRQGRCKEFAKG